MTTIKKSINHKYFEQTFESSISRKIKDEQNFLTLPSSIGFSDVEFRLRIRDELNYLGMTHEELAKASYISSMRMKTLILSTGTFSPSEIKEISRVLGF